MKNIFDNVCTIKIKVYLCTSNKAKNNLNQNKMKATIKDIKEADVIITKSIKAKRGKGTYSDRMEEMMLTYENVYMNGLDCVIILSNGTFQSIWNYV